MPTVEDYFDDDTDLPLPSGSGSASASSSRPRGLQGQGLQGALLEEITDDDPNSLDYDMLAEQGRGIFGENSQAPPPSSSGKGKVAVRDNDGEVRPSGQGNNGPMGGFMGDMMRMQQLEEERLEKLRKQFGNATIASDPSVYKEWNSLYPLYFDSKVSVSNGRRVPREKGLWWPQAQHISVACRNLGLQSCLEPNRTHPADFENPGRVKVLFKKDGKFLNPIIKNRTQLCLKVAEQMGREFPKLAYMSNPAPKRSVKPKSAVPAPESSSGGKNKKKKSTTPTTAKTGSRPLANKLQRLYPTRPPNAPQPVLPLDQRLPLHSPLAPTGIALSSIKRDLETEKENKKKGIASGVGGGDEGAGAGGKEKQPKMKRVVVRGKR